MGWDAQLRVIRVSLNKSVLRVRQVFAEGGVLKEYGFAREFSFGSSGIRQGFAGDSPWVRRGSRSWTNGCRTLGQIFNYGTYPMYHYTCTIDMLSDDQTLFNGYVKTEENRLPTMHYGPSPVSQYVWMEKEVGAPIGYTLSRIEVEVQRFGSTTSYVLNLGRQMRHEQ